MDLRLNINTSTTFEKCSTLFFNWENILCLILNILLIHSHLFWSNAEDYFHKKREYMMGWTSLTDWSSVTCGPSRRLGPGSDCSACCCSEENPFETERCLTKSWNMLTSNALEIHTHNRRLLLFHWAEEMKTEASSGNAASLLWERWRKWLLQRGLLVHLTDYCLPVNLEAVINHWQWVTKKTEWAASLFQLHCAIIPEKNYWSQDRYWWPFCVCYQ